MASRMWLEVLTVPLGLSILSILTKCNCKTTYLEPMESCLGYNKKGLIPNCLLLDEHFSMLENGETLMLSPGYYLLHNFTTSVVRDISNVTIVGNVSDPQSVTITCSKNVGLFFLNVSDLTIIGVTVEHCGIRGIDRVSEIMNATRQIVDLAYTPLSDFSPAIYLAHCPNLELSNVIIRDNRGFGLVGINLVGNVTFHQLQVHHNYPSECVLHSAMSSDVGGSGGGMFLLYQDYVSTWSEPLDTQFQFSEIDINSNYVCGPSDIYGKLLRTSLHFQPPSLSILGAGGLTYALAQTEFEVNANFETCIFRNNSGTHNGAAMLISLFGYSTHSHVSIEKCQFLDNGQELVRQYDEEATGPAGALLLWQQPNEVDMSSVNKQKMSLVTVLDCVFETNMAQRGGAVCVVSSAAVTQDILEIRDSVFHYNMADLGSALYFTASRHSLLQYGTSIHLHNVEVCGNERVSSFLFSESGVIDASYLNISLTGSNYIARNKNTAMSLNSAVVTISGDSVFELNSGSLGGAISLTGESYLIVSAPTNVTFNQNSALIAGGALHFDSTDYNCFVLVSETIPLTYNADYEYNHFFHFKDNEAPLGSAIYGNAFSSCPGNALFLSTSHQVDIVTDTSSLLQNGSLNFINTPPTALVCDTTNMSNVTVLPGSTVNVTLGAFDQFNQSVPVTVFSHLELVEGLKSGQAESALLGNFNRLLINGSTPFTTVPLRVFGTENSTYRVTISSDEAQVELSFDVTLQNCPLGFLYNSTTGACDCYISNFLPKVACNNDGSVTVPDGQWIGYDRERNSFATHPCIFDFCVNVSYVFLSDQDSQCANNRSGLVCGQCREGFSRILGSSACWVCDNSGLAMLVTVPFFAAILLIHIALFNLTITHGYVNGMVFYSNILGLYFNVQGATIQNIMPREVAIVVHSLNQYNTLEACLFDGMTDLHFSLYSFDFPIYLGVYVIVITLFLKYCHTKCLAACLNRVNFNLTHVIATILFITYQRLIRTCYDLIFFTDVTIGSTTLRKWAIDPNVDYFTGLHIFGVILAAFILLSILIPFPILLLFPRHCLRLPHIRKLKPLIDSFTAPLAEGKQFWVGLRLLFRLILFVLATTEETPRYIVICIFVILLTILQAYIKPYKTRDRNLYDLQFLVNLTMISFLAVVSQISPNVASITKTIITILLGIGSSAIVIVCVFFIVSSIPYTDKLFDYIKGKLILCWSAAIKSHTKATSLEREEDNAVTQTNLNVPTLSRRDADFTSTQYVAYREPLFETEDL